jgi:hypothetical protein
MGNKMKQKNPIKEFIFNIGWYIKELIGDIGYYLRVNFLEICIILAILSTLSLIIIAIKI